MIKNKPLYGLFEKVDGKWVRLFPLMSYPKSSAVRIFQSNLLAYAMGAVPYERSLRKVS